MDIKDRIQKLLALSVNPNENEAKAALLKAQELMAKHKLSMADFETAPESEVDQYNWNSMQQAQKRMGRSLGRRVGRPLLLPFLPHSEEGQTDQYDHADRLFRGC